MPKNRSPKRNCARYSNGWIQPETFSARTANCVRFCPAAKARPGDCERFCPATKPRPWNCEAATRSWKRSCGNTPRCCCTRQPPWDWRQRILRAQGLCGRLRDGNSRGESSRRASEGTLASLKISRRDRPSPCGPREGIRQMTTTLKGVPCGYHCKESP
jgi:hypothetical protein